MPSKTLKQLTKLVMDQAKAKGFGVKPEDVNLAEKFALIHSEVAEAFEAYRHKNIEGKDGVAEELGDVIQRVLHLAGVLKLDVEKSILTKLKSNKKRAWDWKKMNEKHS